MIISAIAATEAPIVETVDPIVTAFGALAPDEVLRITPDEGKSLRGTKVGIARVLNGAGFQEAFTQDDDGVMIYVRPVSA